MINRDLVTDEWEGKDIENIVYHAAEFMRSMQLSLPVLPIVLVWQNSGSGLSKK